jgi:hypothetical protein
MKLDREKCYYSVRVNLRENFHYDESNKLPAVSPERKRYALSYLTREVTNKLILSLIPDISSVNQQVCEIQLKKEDYVLLFIHTHTHAREHTHTHIGVAGL